MAILLFVGVSLGVPHLAVGQENPFADLKETFENGAIFKADFHHQTVDSYTQDTVASDGEIWVGKKQYKVQSGPQTVVVDGKISKVYDQRKNRVIVSKYIPEEDDFAPSRILNGVDSTFVVQKEERQGDEIYIRLTSDDPFAIYQEVEIFLSTKLTPKKIVAVDPADNVITTTFEKGTFVDYSDGLFSLEYPENAELVDMRN
ncbi:outer membrane lipoprotein carrier protein LolA [Fodinibius sp. Rm-B-1B1-1]|uniref:LolA family protein n=1 Tax=Fodinibius alkaliphilus TaxID=3140241 RepID=UPI00315A1E54